MDKEQVANNILHANGSNEQPILGDHNNGNFLDRLCNRRLRRPYLKK